MAGLEAKIHNERNAKFATAVHFNQMAKGIGENSEALDEEGGKEEHHEIRCPSFHNFTQPQSGFKSHNALAYVWPKRVS